MLASGREDPHRRIDHSSEPQLPSFTCDYAFLKSEKDPEDKLCLFILKEKRSKSVFSCVCPRKGTESQVAAELFLDAIYELGYRDSKILYKSDQEPALLDVINLVSTSRAAPMVPEQSPVGDSQGNGSIENAVEQVKGAIRRIKSNLESRLGKRLPLRHLAMPWLVQHACFCINRFLVGSDGKTPYMRTRGKSFEKPMVAFGERVLFVKPKNYIGPNLNQAETRAAYGIFLGFRPISNEIYLGTPEGIKKARTIHRLSDDKRWSLEAFEAFRGLPWNLRAPDAGELPDEERLRPIPLDKGPEGDAPPPADTGAKEPEIQPRQFKIFKNDLIKYGYSPHCPGCAAARDNKKTERSQPQL